MKRDILKIILLILAVAPMWWTIVALADEVQVVENPTELWRNHLNEQLLAIKDRRIQILEIIPRNVALETELLSKPVHIDLTEVRDRGASVLKLHYRDEMGRLMRLINLPVKLYIEKKVPVARTDLRRGQIIRAEDVEVVWRESTNLPETPNKMTEVVGSQVKSNVAKGSLIESAKLEAKTLVQRGERVRISVVGDGIQVQAFGVAQESGVRGQTIRLMNIDSKREVYGVVTNSQSVEVRL